MVNCSMPRCFNAPSDLQVWTLDTGQVAAPSGLPVLRGHSGLQGPSWRAATPSGISATTRTDPLPCGRPAYACAGSNDLLKRPNRGPAARAVNWTCAAKSRQAPILCYQSETVYSNCIANPVLTAQKAPYLINSTVHICMSYQTITICSRFPLPRLPTHKCDS